MSQESDRELLVRIDERTESMYTQLLAPPDGRVPKLERAHEELEKVQTDHAEKINQWIGATKIAAWIVGLLVLGFGSVLLAHVMGGKQ